MTSQPIYDQTVADLKFDPATVPPTSKRTDRKIAHERWVAETFRKPRALSVVKPRATRKPKVARQAAGAEGSV